MSPLPRRRDRPPPAPGAPGRGARLGAVPRAAGRLTGRLADGIPRGLVAALAILTLAAVLYTVASRDTKEARGWAEFTMFRLGCAVDPDQRLHVTGCQRIGPSVYLVTFTRSLEGATVVVSRGACCPGQIRASVSSRTSVTVVAPKLKGPVRATVFVP